MAIGAIFIVFGAYPSALNLGIDSSSTVLVFITFCCSLVMPVALSVVVRNGFCGLADSLAQARIPYVICLLGFEFVAAFYAYAFFIVVLALNLFITCAAFCVLSLFGSREEEPLPSQSAGLLNKNRCGDSVGVAVLITFSSFGFAFEELGREEPSGYLLVALFVFALLIVCIGCHFIKKHNFAQPQGIFMVLVPGIFLSFIAGPVFGMTLAMTSILMIVLMTKGKDLAGRRFCSLAITGFGLGILIGLFTMAKWGVLYTTGDAIMEAQDTLAFLYLVVPVLAGLMLTSSCFSFSYCLSLLCILQLSDDELSSEKSAFVMYLRSQGLSQQEAQVAMLIDRGFTGNQIAHVTHYSLGGVNTLRSSAYAKLSIHSASELHRLLELNVPSSLRR